MKKSASLVASLIFSAFMLGGGFVGVAQAQEKVETKNLFENDKVVVYESRLKPGVEGPSIERPFRVVRALTDGTIQRTYADGKTEIVQWKAGQVEARGPNKAYSAKNIGKSDFVVYVVQPK